jgi:hypothetical protein
MLSSEMMLSEGTSPPKSIKFVFVVLLPIFFMATGLKAGIYSPDSNFKLWTLYESRLSLSESLSYYVSSLSSPFPVSLPLS